jgi:hypothetical protein
MNPNGAIPAAESGRAKVAALDGAVEQLHADLDFMPGFLNGQPGACIV